MKSLALSFATIALFSLLPECAIGAFPISKE